MSGKEKTKEQLIEELQRLRQQVAELQEPEECKREEAERERLLTTLERRSAQLQTALKVSNAVSSILDPDELIQQVVNLVRERFDLYYAGLFLVDQTGAWTGEPGRWAVLQAGTGEAGRQMLERGHKLEVGGASMIGWCVANRQARIALDVGQEAVRFDNPLLPETHSEIALPLISRGQAVGAWKPPSGATSKRHGPNTCPLPKRPATRPGVQTPFLWATQCCPKYSKHWSDKTQSW